MMIIIPEREEPKVLEFITAFSADESYLEKIRQESGLMEIKKPQS
jgi:hypothetical protein